MQCSKGQHKIPRQVSCERLFSTNTIYYKTILLIHTQNLKLNFNSGTVALFLNVTAACKTFYMVQKSTLLTALASCFASPVTREPGGGLAAERLNASVGGEALHSTIVPCGERVQRWEEWALLQNSCLSGCGGGVDETAP